MKIAIKTVELSTTERFQLVNITKYVEVAVQESGVCRGIVVVSVPHATAGVIVNENEPGLLEDILQKVRDFSDPGSRKWRHNSIDDNAHAHISSALFGHERVMPVNDCRLVRGTWQDIFFLEMDGPREKRRVVITVIGEKE
ncbi:MAG: secondary thiamine-phosphate synthase enzyme YjbQ [Thermosphaera sp.]